MDKQAQRSEETKVLQLVNGMVFEFRSDSRTHALYFIILPPTSPLSDKISVEILGLDGLFLAGEGSLGPKLT